MLTSIQKIDAMMAGVTRAEIQAMPPAYRQRLAQMLRHIADLADPPKKRELAKSGVLGDLHDGKRAD